MKIKSAVYIFGATGFMIIMSLLSCSNSHNQTSAPFRNEIDSIAVTWIPDIQEGVFEASVHRNGSRYVLVGETDNPGAKKALTGFLEKKGVIFTDSMKVLPDTTEVKKAWGLVTVSVCNIRAYQSFDAELVSQALMGTPVKILKNEDGWMMIQTPDTYIGWVDNDAVQSMTKGEYDSWKASPRIFYTRKTGDILAEPQGNDVVSDIVAGSVLRVGRDVNGSAGVILPDGRKGFIGKNDAIPFSNMTTSKYLSQENLINTAKSFMGIPYLWGGTSSKGFDCSGFVKTVYYLNGVLLKRDASQQFGHGLRIMRSWYPDSLKPGDLLFFGSAKRGRLHATHVAMYIGNTEFIHASGMVKINSLDSTRQNFSRFRRDSFLGVRRIIGAPSDNGISSLSGNCWYY